MCKYNARVTNDEQIEIFEAIGGRIRLRASPCLAINLATRISLPIHDHNPEAKRAIEHALKCQDPEGGMQARVFDRLTIQAWPEDSELVLWIDAEICLSASYEDASRLINSMVELSTAVIEKQNPGEAAALGEHD